jgi:hypothetical protein
VFHSGLAKLVTTDGDGQPQQPYRPRWLFCYMQAYEFEPSFYVDISDVYEQKVRAVQAHASQVYVPGVSPENEPETVLSRPEFWQLLELRARYFGTRIGVQYAEAFLALGPVGTAEPIGVAEGAGQLSRRAWLSRRRWCAGVMSGTSLDGVDVVVAEFWQERRRRRFRLLAHHHEEFPPMLRYQLLRAQEEPVSIGEVARLHWELARCYADAVHACCRSIGITPQQLDVVGVHGQTVWHEPAAAEGGVGLQLGNLPALAQWLGCPVVGISAVQTWRRAGTGRRWCRCSITNSSAHRTSMLLRSISAGWQM